MFISSVVILVLSRLSHTRHCRLQHNSVLLIFPFMVVAHNPVHSLFCSVLIRCHCLYKVCLGQKNVSGSAGPLCHGCGPEERVLPRRWRRRRWRWREGRRKNATTRHTSLGCRCKGTGCCLCGGQDALFSLNTSMPDFQATSETEWRLRTGRGSLGGI